MRTWAWAFGVVLVAGSVGAQDLRVPIAPDTSRILNEVPIPDASPITVTTRVRHVSTVVLPAGTDIIDVIVGDAAAWDVTAAAHLAFIRPLVSGARTNLVLLTAAGVLVPVVVMERTDAPVDVVVPVDVVGGAAAASPVLTTPDAVAAAARRATEAWAAAEAAETHGAAQTNAARTAAQAALDATRADAPRQLVFPYRWTGAAAAVPWLVEALWHDGRRTYLRTRAADPVLYEQREGELVPVDGVTVLDGVLHVVPRVLGAGAIEVDGRRLAWTVAAEPGAR